MAGIQTQCGRLVFSRCRIAIALDFRLQPLNGPGDYFGHDRDVYYFGSAHTGGFSATFADGSVHTINYDIDVIIFNALGNSGRRRGH